MSTRHPSGLPSVSGQAASYWIPSDHPDCSLTRTVGNYCYSTDRDLLIVPPHSEEKGYGPDEVDLKEVDLCRYNPYFTRRQTLMTTLLSHGRELQTRVHAFELKRCAYNHIPFLGLLEKDGYPTAYVATVPTLVVPLEKTLSSEIASRYKAIRDSRVGAAQCSITSV